ncbi:hypothetical protein HXX76_004716 [Chlamydomonas incerta]|uniref:Uncharacterized protein n=1 Tax=Chlamydomonas incerta TaxID=51695 RepID=A0A835T5L6_CHLIN|nr:hypothetical protein HXX76_004716 [Chlamydomonas incerta]|eukprot:KAG2439357.1 hypothetical protein HXX76_004716 [Chlamydomonas incerta]
MFENSVPRPSAMQPVAAVLTDVINTGLPLKPSAGAVDSTKRGPAAISPTKLAGACVAPDAVLDQFSQLQLTPGPAASPSPRTITASPLTGFSFRTPASFASDCSGILTHPQRTPEERVLRLFADEDPDAEDADAPAALTGTSSSFQSRMEQALSPAPCQGGRTGSGAAEQAPGENGSAAQSRTRSATSAPPRQPAFAEANGDDSSDDEIDLAELVRLGVSPISISSCCRTPVTPADVLQTLISPGEAVGTGADADLGVSPVPFNH